MEVVAVIDFETTGLSPAQGDRATEIAAVIVEDGKVVEWVTRQRGSTGQWELRYVHEKAKRGLRIAVTDTLIVEAFDDAIWRRP